MVDDDDTKLRRFVADQGRRRLKEGTVEARNRILTRALQHFGSFDAMTTPAVTVWLQQYGNQTKHSYTDAISEFFKWAVSCGIYERDPTEDIVLPKVVATPIAIDDDDLAVLIRDAAYKPELRVNITLMAYQGLKGQEVAFLTGEQIDLDANPPVLKVDGDRAAIIHPQVVKSFQTFGPIPKRGRIFPNRKSHNISHNVNEHIHACGVDGTANSLLWWYRLQVQNTGKNFGRTSAPAPSPIEARIVTALEREVPSSAVCYQQALHDLNDQNRISFRGTANELRSSVWDILEQLAPDDAVMSAEGFKLEPGMTGPTQAQRGRFIAKSKGLHRPTFETSLKYIEDHVGSLSRSLYSRSSSAVHVKSERGEVQTIKGYVDAVFADVFDIHRAP